MWFNTVLNSRRVKNVAIPCHMPNFLKIGRGLDDSWRWAENITTEEQELQPRNSSNVALSRTIWALETAAAVSWLRVQFFLKPGLGPRTSNICSYSKVGYEV